MKQIPASLLTLVAGIVITLISFWVGSHNNLLPIQASTAAPAVDSIFNVMVIIGTALFIIVEGAILYFAIRYRRPKDDDSDGVPLEGNLQLEIFWTAIPAIIVIGLGVYSVDVYREMGGLSVGEHAMHSSMMMGQASSTLVAQAPSDVVSDVPTLLADASDDDASTAKYGFGAAPGAEEQAPDVVVNVTGMQFAWLYEYPNEDDLMTAELHIPVNKDVQLNLEATDVIHSFWVPAFRLKQDAIPGKPTQLRFVATRPGTYDVVCAELCGSYHGGMRSEVIVHTEEEYQEWLVEEMEYAMGSNDEGAIASASAALPVDTTQLSTAEYLAPYSEEWGVSPTHLPQHDHHSGHHGM
ncbi:MAG: cytochrome c oxidase subunit II [Cyanothece sp. SIO2G6]|nr:cytochrome c oxidase subunit II [Cyanothece sp. SIO2G6]